MSKSINARQLVWRVEKLVGLLKTSFASHPFPCRRSLRVIRCAGVALERGKFFIGYGWPLRPYSTVPLQPILTILTVETGRLPNHKQAVTWKKALRAM
jgi:hypothetical protein